MPRRSSMSGRRTSARSVIMKSFPMRIAILGNAGTGKSTLAKWLVERSGASLLDLDSVAWEPGQVAVQRSETAAEEDVRAFCAASDDWVVEGCYANLVRVALTFEAHRSAERRVGKEC